MMPSPVAGEGVLPLAAILNLLVIGVLLSTLVFVTVVGGKVERAGAAILAVNVALTFAAQGLLGDHAPIYVLLLLDLAAALGFGALALRNPEKLWPGVAGVAMTFVMAFSATRATGFPLSEFAYLTALNLSSLLVKVAMVAGAWNHRWGGRGAGEGLQPA